MWSFYFVDIHVLYKEIERERERERERKGGGEGESFRE